MGIVGIVFNSRVDSQVKHSMVVASQSFTVVNKSLNGMLHMLETRKVSIASRTTIVRITINALIPC